MNFMEVIADKWNAMCAKVGPVLMAIGRFFGKVSDVLMWIWGFLVKLRKIFLSVPVALVAFKLAQQNMDRLPQTVGLDLQVDGTFALQLTREWACAGPLLLTLVCLVLMLCSKRVLTPWVVSVFTLVIPIFIWVINIFPS